MDSKTETDYDNIHPNGLTKITNYFYDNPDHKELTREEFTNSDLSVTIKKLKYPQDFNFNQTSSSQDVIALKLMGDRTVLGFKHMTGIPIETLDERLINNTINVTGGYLNKYQSIASSNNQVFIVSKQSFLIEQKNPIDNSSFLNSGIHSNGISMDPHYKLATSYDLFDTYGNLLTCHDEFNVPRSFEWDNEGKSQIASFHNAAFNNNVIGNECSFSGFEDDGQPDDNWSGNIGVTLYDAHTGNYCANLGRLNGHISHQFNPSRQNQRYRLSCWIKFPQNYTLQSGHLRIDITSSNNSNNQILNGSLIEDFTGTPEKWCYQEVIIDLENIHHTYTGISNFLLTCKVENSFANIVLIDDIRFEALPSQTVSVTYDPLFNQISSISNPKSLPQFYGYDSFGRLSNSTDQNMAVKSLYEYHFKNP